MNLKRLFPFLAWPRPTPATLRQDAKAGFSVGLVMVPQAVAYATLAGMPPQTGLYAALLPALIGILWGSAGLLSVGPVALTSLLVAGSLYPLAEAGSTQWVTLAIWLSLYAGLIQLMLGAFRFGQIASLVSQPVLIGFLNAAALIIIALQIPPLLGQRSFAQIIPSLASPTPVLLVGPLGLLMLLAAKRYTPRLPGILLVTLAGIALSWLLGFEAWGVPLVGAIPTGFPPISLLPTLSFDLHRELLPAALIIALISYAEAMTSCRTLARRLRQPWDENQELVGQGLAKIASAFSGSFPVSGSFSRSALNLYAGAVSGWSTLFTASCVLLTLLFLTDVLYYLPYPLLAAMIIVPVLNLLDLKALRRAMAISRPDGVIAWSTFAVTLLATPRLHWGVFVGVGLTMVFYLHRRGRPRIIEVGLHPDGTLRDRARFPLEALAPDLLAVRIDSALNFLTISALERFITQRSNQDKRIKRVLLTAASINDIDASGIDGLEFLLHTLRSDGVELHIAAIKKQVWEVLERSGLAATLGPECIHATDLQAIENLTAQTIAGAGPESAAPATKPPR